MPPPPRSAASRTAAASAAAPLSPIARGATLGDEAYRKLRVAMMSGQLRPGEALSLRPLAQALGVSLTPAREAMGRLVAEGALVMGPHRTVQVPRLSSANYEECLQVRLALEPLAAARAADRLPRAELARLRALQQELREAHARGDTRHVLQCNEAFHFTLYEHAGWPTVVQILESMWLRVGPTLNLLHEAAIPAKGWRGDVNHRRILAALAKADPDGVARAVRQDLLEGSTQVLQVLAQQERTQP